MNVMQAQTIDLPTATDEDLRGAWNALAGRISSEHVEHGLQACAADTHVFCFQATEREMKRRGLPRPSGNYVLTAHDRIAWVA